MAVRFAVSLLSLMVLYVFSVLVFVDGGHVSDSADPSVKAKIETETQTIYQARPWRAAIFGSHCLLPPTAALQRCP